MTSSISHKQHLLQHQTIHPWIGFTSLFSCSLGSQRKSMTGNTVIYPLTKLSPTRFNPWRVVVDAGLVDCWSNSHVHLVMVNESPLSIMNQHVHKLIYHHPLRNGGTRTPPRVHLCSASWPARPAQAGCLVAICQEQGSNPSWWVAGMPTSTKLEPRHFKFQRLKFLHVMGVRGSRDSRLLNHPPDWWILS